VSEDPRPKHRRTVERGEGEVTNWPRGLVSYVPKGPADESPSPDEDRTANRLELAARLLGLLRARGEDVDAELSQLRAAERAYERRDRARATALVEDLLGRLQSRTSSAGGAEPSR